MQRLAPEDRRELRALKQVAKLGFRIGQALSVGRAVGARPDAPSGGDDHDHSSLRRSNAPGFFEQRVRPIGRLQGVSEQKPVDGTVRQRQHLRVHERRGATSGFRPDRDALFCGHQGQAAASAVAESVEIRRAVTQCGDRKAGAAIPALTDHAPDQPAGDAAEGRAVKALQAEDVERHRYRPDGAHDFERAPALSQCVGVRNPCRRRGGGETGTGRAAIEEGRSGRAFGLSAA